MVARKFGRDCHRRCSAKFSISLSNKRDRKAIITDPIDRQDRQIAVEVAD